MTTTLAQLRTQVRRRADMENSQFCTDTELNDYINSSIAELYDLIISAYDGKYNVQTVTLSTSANTTSYALPDGTLYTSAPALYKLLGVDVQNGSYWLSLRRFNFNERNRNVDLTWNVSGGPNLRYDLVGGNLQISPTPTGTYTLKLWYIPVATKLVSDSDILNDLNQFSEYVVVDAAIKCRDKEESDVSVLMAQKGALEKRVISMAQNRDAGQSESISDIYAANNHLYFGGE